MSLRRARSHWYVKWICLGGIVRGMLTVGLPRGAKWMCLCMKRPGLDAIAASAPFPLLPPARSSEVETRANFVQEYRGRKQQHLLAMAKSRANGARGRAKSVAKKTLPTKMKQADAKAWIPPAPSSIWASYTRQAWCGHVPPFRRCSTAWALYQDDGLALQDLLCKMWAQHFERSGLGKECCVFDYDEAMARLSSLDKASKPSSSSSSA